MMKIIAGLVIATWLVAGGNAFADRIEVTLADATVLTVYLLVPEDRTDTEFPLVILMGGGSGEDAIARDVQGWLGQDLAARGWAVAVPVSPDNNSFRGRNNRLIPLLVSALQNHERIAEGRTLLAGISNGGMSALEVATLSPQDYLGIMAVPAVVPRALNLAALAGMPIYLRIGDQDELGWMNRLEETKVALQGAGAVVDADLVFMSTHMFQMDWENLDPWLESVRP